MLSERQEQILNNLIVEYITLAQPISSQLLQKRGNFDVSPATIRNEMQVLTEEGFLTQPHASAGRIPTDKGYRFFVDEIEEEHHPQEFREIWREEFRQEFADVFGVLRSVSKKLAARTSNLGVVSVPDEGVQWKEGWESLFEEPEFKEREDILAFTKFLNDFEEGMKDFDTKDAVKVYIGTENPFSLVRDFAVILCKCRFFGNGRGYIAIVGPKRMAYQRNIGLMSSLRALFEEVYG